MKFTKAVIDAVIAASSGPQLPEQAGAVGRPSGSPRWQPLLDEQHRAGCIHPGLRRAANLIGVKGPRGLFEACVGGRRLGHC